MAVLIFRNVLVPRLLHGLVGDLGDVGAGLEAAYVGSESLGLLDVDE